MQIPRPKLASLAGTLALGILMLAAFSPARADDGEEAASPPGILVDPPTQSPDDEEEDEVPRQPGGPGCPINQRPLELLV